MSTLLDSVFHLPPVKKVTKKRYMPHFKKDEHSNARPMLLHKDDWPSVNVETGTSFGDKGLSFDLGQWCEYLGTDMRWHLAPVRRVVKMAPEDYDGMDDEDEIEYEYFYSIGSSTLVDPNTVRASEEALKRVFGFGPWVWQQWACLQLETFTRFQEGHDRDFANANFNMVAKDLWDYWLNHDKNKEFKKIYDDVDLVKGFYEEGRYDDKGELRIRKPQGCADKLDVHILSPFRIMDEIAKNKGGKYTLVDDVSIFTYVSFMGSGWGIVIATLAIQFVVPGILLLAAMTQYPGGQRRFPQAFVTTWELFCDDNGNILGRLMNVIVLILYTVRVLPSLLYEMYSSSGEDDTGSSKMDEVRRQVFESGDDTLFMQLGYKLDIYANSVYMCVLMTLMLFILFITDDIFSIILNALALEFVASLDEEISKAEWFDERGEAFFFYVFPNYCVV